ncbi:major facilitator superfamily domain-containing protein [Myxozyma melibiosi]|uniref:Major facilitator superfamily domain-containing protein n=1 Tax=Myxozyma melibiosi TaxID=54550 RepID=A0ABR1F335_9ASCO
MDRAPTSTATATAPTLTRTRSRRSSSSIVPISNPPPLRRASTALVAQRRPSMAASMASFRTVGLSEKELYGEAPQDLIGLQRIKTFETVASHYQIMTAADGEMSAPADGLVLRDIDPELVTWDSPDDPENPRNWSTARKWKATVTVSLYTFLGPFSSSILSPATTQIAERFGVTNTTVKALIVSIFVLAWAIMPLLVAPLSEIFGRRVVLNISIFFLVIFNMACGLSQSLAQILVFRFLAGCGGAGPLAIGAGVVADVWDDDHRTQAIGLFSIGPTLGPILAPVIAGFIAQNLVWRWIFWILTIVCGVVFGLGVIMLEETYAPILLLRKAQAMRKATGNQSLHTVFEIAGESLYDKLISSVTRPLMMLVTNPIVFSLGLYMAFTYGFLYLLLVTFSPLYRQTYGYSLGIAGLLYLGPGVGFFIGILTVTTISQKIYARLVAAHDGVAKPEYRLPSLAIGSFFMPVGLIWYGWSAEKHLHWIMPVIGAAMFGIAMISVFQCIQSYLIDMNPKYAASATAAGTTFRSLFGFAMPLFATQMYAAMGYGWGNTMLGLVALAIGSVFPVVIFYKGERIRKWNDARMDAHKAAHDARKEAKLARKLKRLEGDQEKKIEKDGGVAATELRRIKSQLSTDDATVVEPGIVGQRTFDEIPEEDAESVYNKTHPEDKEK